MGTHCYPTRFVPQLFLYLLSALLLPPKSSQLSQYYFIDFLLLMVVVYYWLIFKYIGSQCLIFRCLVSPTATLAVAQHGAVTRSQREELQHKLAQQDAFWGPAEGSRAQGTRLFVAILNFGIAAFARFSFFSNSDEILYLFS